MNTVYYQGALIYRHTTLLPEVLRHPPKGSILRGVQKALIIVPALDGEKEDMYNAIGYFFEKGGITGNIEFLRTKPDILPGRMKARLRAGGALETKVEVKDRSVEGEKGERIPLEQYIFDTMDKSFFRLKEAYEISLENTSEAEFKKVHDSART